MAKVSATFGVEKDGARTFVLTEQGTLKQTFNWLLPVIIGVLSVGVIAVAVVLLHRKRKKA